MTSAEAEPIGPEPTYRVELEGFEGPLDLLLHLCRKHELDVLDIPIAFITEKYLAYLEMMREVHIDVASEYLVMAATLAHIKSKMLLPQREDEEQDDSELEEIDPRADLVRRLLEYQKYKDAAASLAARATLGRDLFPRGEAEAVPEGPAPFAAVSVFKLFDAFQHALKRANIANDHQVMFERVGLAERIVELTEMLHERRRLCFSELFAPADGSAATRAELIITFLALLEMCKMRVARVLQPDPLGDLEIELAPRVIGGAAAPEAAPEASSGDQS